MKEYPSVSKEIRNGVSIYAFDKIDGSNIRAEWGRKKKAFWKFGTRTQMIDETDPTFGEAVKIVKEKYEKDLHDIFMQNRYEKAMAFFEFHGNGSFAGRHLKEAHDVTLIDVRVHKKGILLPQDYLKLFGNLDMAKLLYTGNANSEFEELVRNRQLEGMTFEGVICKGPYQFPGQPLMFKIKSKEWLDKLKHYCDGCEIMYNKLS